MMKQLLFLPLFLLLSLLVARCSDEAAVRHRSTLDAAERLMTDNADSASLLLAAIPHPEEMSDRDFARWCMLCGHSTHYTHADTLLVHQWRRAQKWIDKHGSPEERAQVGLFLGRAYAEDEEWDLAMKTYAEALHYAKEHGAYNVAGYICTYMADLYNFKEMYNEIREKYTEAVSLFSKAGNLKSQVYAMKNLAMEVAYIDSFSYAKKIMAKADSIAVTLHNQRINYNIANAYANLYDLQKRYDLAEKYYKKAISLDARHGMKDSIGLASIYIASGKIKQAKEIVDNIALHMPTAYGVNLLYGDIYKLSKDYKKALYFKELCFEIVDSLNNVQNKTKILEIERKYNHLKMQEENGRLRNTRQRAFIYLIMCTSLLIIGSVVFYYYRKHCQNTTSLARRETGKFGQRTFNYCRRAIRYSPLFGNYAGKSRRKPKIATKDSFPVRKVQRATKTTLRELSDI